MALQYPGISYLKGYDGKISDILDQWLTGVEAGRNDRDEANAGDLIAKLFSAQGGSQQPLGGTPLNAAGMGNDGIVNGSHQAVANAEDPMLASYFANTRRAESGGNDSARNPNSSATGRYQFIDSTWQGLMDSHPELGLTPDGRNDPAQQERAMKAFTMDNARQLKGAGVGINPGSLYAAHFLGAGGASKVLAADPNTPVASLVGPEVVQANPQLANMTVGQFQEWAASKGGNGSGGYAGPAGNGGAPTGGKLNAELMSQLFNNRATRPLAIELMKSVSAGQNAKPIEINNRLVDPYTGQVIQDFSDEQKPLTDLAKLKADLEGGRITQAQYDAAVAKETAIGGGTTLKVNQATGEVEFQQGGSSDMPKLTEGQSKDAFYYIRGAGANDALTENEESLTSLKDTVVNGIPLAGNYFTSDGFKNASRDGKEFLAAVLRKDSGGAITSDEWSYYGPMYLPAPGDSADQLARKRDARQRAMDALKATAGPGSIVIDEFERGRAPETGNAGGESADTPKGGRPIKTIGGKTYYQDEAGDWYEQ